MSEAGSSAFDAVVIGGSAGALPALLAILQAMKAELHCAVFVVLHLLPERESLLASLLAQQCALAVKEAEDKELPQPGTVYVAPPDYHLLVASGPMLALSVDEPVLFSRPSIDVLFESAADVYQSRLLAIVLSGASEDGAAGLAAVRQAGGMAVVQDPASALAPTMPQAARLRSGTEHVLALDALEKFAATLN